MVAKEETVHGTDHQGDTVLWPEQGNQLSWRNVLPGVDRTQHHTLECFNVVGRQVSTLGLSDDMPSATPLPKHSAAAS